MTTRETERPPRAPYTDGFEVEQEVDFGRYWRALVQRWWLVLIGLVLGAIIGFGASVGGGRAYDATAVIYLGQPFAPGGTVQIQSLPTRLGFVNQLAHSRAILHPIALKVGIAPVDLARNVTIENVSGGSTANGKNQLLSPLVQLVVTNPSARKAVDAANLIGTAIAQRFSEYVDVKLSVYRSRVARDRTQLAQVDKAIAQAEDRLVSIQNDRTLTNVEKLVLQANVTNLLEFNQNRQTNLEGGLLSLQELLSLANDVERARLEEPAAAARQPGPSKRTYVVVGAVIGIIVGILVALLWEPVARRVRSRPAT